MASVSDLYLEQGRTIAEARRRRGELYGGIVAGLSQIPGQVMATRQAERDRYAQQSRQAASDRRAQGEFDMRAAADERAAAAEGRAAATFDRTNEDAHRAALAEGAVKVRAAGYDPNVGVMWLQDAQRRGLLTPDEHANLSQQAQSPDGIKRIVDFIAPPAKPADPVRLGPGDVLVPPTGGAPLASNPKPIEEKPLTFSAPTPAMVNGKRVLIRGGSDGGFYDPRGQRVLDVSPDLPPTNNDGEPLVAIMGENGKPVLVRRRDAVGKTPASNREQGRPVISGDANRIADFDTSLDDTTALRSVVKVIDPKTGKETGTTGTAAYLGAKAPNWVTEMTGWGADAKSRNAVIARVKQVIGKALEGGVLRKEDEEKYKDILPTIGDVSSVVKTKLEGLDSAIRKRRDTLLDSLEDAGYEVGNYRKRAPHGTTAAPTGKIRARDPQGVLHEADAGTALPAGWKEER